MLKQIARFTTILTCALVLIVAVPKAEAAKAKLVTLNGNGVNTGYDITGDGKKDRIQFINSWQKQLTVKVNGKTALSLKNTYHYSTSAYHITLGNGKKFLFIKCEGEDGLYNVSGIYRYSGGKLVCDVNYRKLSSKITSCGFRIKLLRGNKLRVWVQCVTPGLARFYIYTDAVYSGGKMKLNRKNMRFSTDVTSSGIQNGKATYTMAKTVQGYVYSDSMKKSFVVRAGTRVKLLNYKISGSKHRILIKLSNGKKTWINDNLSGAWNNYLLRGIYYWA